MRNRIVIILVSALIILTGGFLFIKFSVLKARDFKEDRSKEKNILDLGPSVIAKLQQLVKDGSNGLYILSIEKTDPDLLTSKLDIINARLDVDSAVMRQLNDQKLLPDNIYKIHFDSLHIDGIGIADLIHSNRIEITHITINNPLFEVFHKTQAYNKTERSHNDTISLYHRIKGQMDKISIGNINIENGTYIHYDVVHPAKKTKINGITVHINDVLIDSSTQFATNRFFFAKQASLEAKNYTIPTADSLYYLKFGTISVSAEQHTITLLDVSLTARGNREQFENKLHYRNEMYHLVLPKIMMNEVDWTAITQRQTFMAKKVEIAGGDLTIYLDRRLPSDSAIQLHNFPQQMLMKFAIPVAVNSLEMKHVNISYEEFNPDANRSATAYFDDVKARLNYVSNISVFIKEHPIADLSGTGLLMHRVPITARLTLNMLRCKTGDFTADMHVGKVDNLTVNPVTETLGLFSVRSGIIQEGTVHIDGNNDKVKCKFAVSYTDLHVDLLKKANENGDLKRKPVTGFIANLFFIKNANPLKGQALRQPDFSISRGHHRNLFSLVWITMSTGFLKTAGLPVKL